MLEPASNSYTLLTPWSQKVIINMTSEKTVVGEMLGRSQGQGCILLPSTPPPPVKAASLPNQKIPTSACGATGSGSFVWYQAIKPKKGNHFCARWSMRVQRIVLIKKPKGIVLFQNTEKNAQMFVLKCVHFQFPVRTYKQDPPTFHKHTLKFLISSKTIYLNLNVLNLLKLFLNQPSFCYKTF